MKMNRYILFCLSHILLLSCQGQSKSSNVSKDSIYVNSKMMAQQELMQTSILSKYGKDNGYNPLSYQDFQNRCMEYWGLSLHKEPQDYVLSIGGYTEYTINEWGRFLYTEAENLFYQPEIEGEPTKEDAMKMLYAPLDVTSLVDLIVICPAYYVWGVQQLAKKISVLYT